METKSLEECVQELERLLEEGNFSRAKERFWGTLRKIEYSELPRNNPWRINATAIAARLYFYRGENETAYRELGNYVNEESEFLNNDHLQVGQKLMLAECAFSKRDFESGRPDTERILEECKKKDDTSGMGEAYRFWPGVSARAISMKNLEMRAADRGSVFFAP